MKARPQAKSDAHVQLAFENSSPPPWKSEKIGGGAELRWIPSHPPAGEYLMKLHRLEGEGPAGSISETSELLWLGIPDSLVNAAKQTLSDWFAKHPGLDGNGKRCPEVTVILGSDLDQVTGGLSKEEAFAMPLKPDMVNRLIRVLICIGLPQCRRTEAEEVAWLKTALIHELEHVWQFHAIDDTLIEKPWRVLAEMCAVYAERAHLPESRIFLDFGADFLRRVHCGLLNADLADDKRLHWRDVGPYWAFPFIEHLESVAPGIHRGIWTETGSDSEKVEKGPWIAIDRFLQGHETSFPKQWSEFCMSLLSPVRDSSAAQIADRYSPRLPTLRLDLGQATDQTPWLWELWPISAHWVNIIPARDRAYKVAWKRQMDVMEKSDFQVHARHARVDSGWTDITAAGSLEIAAGTEAIDLLFIDASVPDMSRVFDSRRNRYCGVSVSKLEFWVES